VAALFFDIDGTLIDSYNGVKTVSEPVRAELKRVQAQGHRLFIASGRPPMMLTPEIRCVDFDGAVLINGGLVELGGEPIHEERMGVELVRDVHERLEELGYEHMFVTAHHIYMPRTNQWLLDFFAGGREFDFSFDYDLADVMERTIKIECGVAIPERARVAELLKQHTGQRVNCDGHGGTGTFEVYPSVMSKAKGISIALEHLGLTREDAYAFGDGTNDLEMIDYCGTGVAMANGEDVVLQAADRVCPPVGEDGLATALRELFPA
jgi:Cof subfamily protein (haloacid dehalogenase superfamily)